MPGLDTAEAFDNQSHVEGHDQRHQGVERDGDPEFPVWRLERCGKYRPPFVVDPRQPLAKVRIVPSERLQLEPDLLVAEVLSVRNRIAVRHFSTNGRSDA